MVSQSQAGAMVDGQAKQEAKSCAEQSCRKEGHPLSPPPHLAFILVGQRRMQEDGGAFEITCRGILRSVSTQLYREADNRCRRGRERIVLEAIHDDQANEERQEDGADGVPIIIHH